MYQPTASTDVLYKRAQLLHQLRMFFHERGVMEVDVPVIAESTVTDVYLEPLRVPFRNRDCYLQTSPEYYLKRVLARDQRCLYTLGKAFRQDECGRHHRSEFTMLEWYRVGFDDRKLIAEVADLFACLAPGVELSLQSYGDVFAAHLGINPHLASEVELKALVADKLDFQGELDSSSACLDLLFSHCIEPHLGPNISVIYDYPKAQCALARVQQDAAGHPVARRFEVFWHGLELANGYWELCDPEEQYQRFLRDQSFRAEHGMNVPHIDSRFMAALHHGLPESAGIALGVDRLLMCLLDKTDIAQVMPFANG